MRNYSSTPAEERFWKHVQKDNSNACWLWTGWKDPYGYGRFAISSSEKITAHRFSWQMVHGPLLSDLHVHHKCKEKLCVNPDHLEALNPKIHHEQHKKTHCIHGHEFSENNTYWNKGRRFCRTCQRKKGLEWSHKNGWQGGVHHKERTHCKYGHPLDGTSARQRYCRRCVLESNRRYKERNKEKGLCREGHPLDGIKTSGKRFCIICSAYNKKQNDLRRFNAHG